MSPEERRQLRHDVRDAGRNIYPRRASPKNPPRNQRNQQKPRQFQQQGQSQSSNNPERLPAGN
jgi:hypothetical protein